MELDIAIPWCHYPIMILEQSFANPGHEQKYF